MLMFIPHKGLDGTLNTKKTDKQNSLLYLQQQQKSLIGGNPEFSGEKW